MYDEIGKKEKSTEEEENAVSFWIITLFIISRLDVKIAIVKYFK